MRKLFAAVPLALVALATFASAVFAVDYSTQIDTLGDSIIAELTTNLPAVALVAFGILAVTVGFAIVMKLVRRGTKVGS